MKTTRYVNSLIIISIIINLIFLSGCNTQKNITREKEGFLFDTVVVISLTGVNPEETINEALDYAASLDKKWNKNNPESEIYKINHSDNKPVFVSKETINLLNYASEFSKSVNMVTNPAIGSVTSLWDFKSESPEIPEKEKIAEALNHTEINNICINDDSVCLTDIDAKIDPGFIAKGYAADLIKEFILNKGDYYGFINLGGNVLTVGQKPGNKPFVIGIKDPDINSPNSIITTVEVFDGSVVTSGIYERYFISGSEIYHHILDTKTGYPIRNNLLSVTVIGKESITCDALSTALFAAGYDNGKKILNNYPGYKAIYINNEMEILTLE